MINRRMSKKYAWALFEESAGIKIIENVYNDLLDISKVFKDYPDFYKLLNCVTIPFVSKREIIDKVFSGLNNLSGNFIKVLYENNLGYHFFDILSEFYKMYLNDQNKIEIKLTSAYKMDKEDIESLKNILEEKIEKKVILDYEINKDLIAGLVIQYKSTVIDASAQNYLHDLHAKMTSIRS